jgi:hypothetical protein
LYDEQQEFKPLPFDYSNVSGITIPYSISTSYPVNSSLPIFGTIKGNC